MAENEPTAGQRVVSNAAFADVFPRLLKMRRTQALQGTIIRRSDAEDCFVVVWDHKKTPDHVHRKFFDLEDRTNG